MKFNNFIKSILVLVVISSNFITAQELNVDMQLRPRFEYRNGFKQLMPNTQYPTSFVSNRARLNVGFSNEKLKTYISFQNVSVWGDVASTSTTDKNSIKLYQAWASYQLNNDWSAKIGRQVLSYDNQRIFGGLDWAQQGQSHDAALIQYTKNKSKLDVGFALNNSSEVSFESEYAVTYKNMQYAWFHHDFDNVGLSILALNNGYQYEDVTEGKFKNAYLQTVGSFVKFGKSKFYGDAAIYGQFGEQSVTTDKQKVSAFYGSLNLGYKVTENFNGEIGFEYLSGTDGDETSDKSNSFTPLFGTNHGFNGFMDYFYVGNHKNSVGLQDYYIRLKYNKDKWQFAMIPHVFLADGNILNPTTFEKEDSYLGTEIDLTATYKVNKDIKITGGYSQMFGSSSLEILKDDGDKNNMNNWAWLMITINPKLF